MTDNMSRAARGEFNVGGKGGYDPGGPLPARSRVSMTDTTNLRDQIAAKLPWKVLTSWNDRLTAAEAVMAVVEPIAWELADARVALEDYEHADEEVMADAYRMSMENDRLRAQVAELRATCADHEANIEDALTARDEAVNEAETPEEPDIQRLQEATVIPDNAVEQIIRVVHRVHTVRAQREMLTELVESWGARPTTSRVWELGTRVESTCTGNYGVVVASDCPLEKHVTVCWDGDPIARQAMEEVLVEVTNARRPASSHTIVTGDGEILAEIAADGNRLPRTWRVGDKEPDGVEVFDKHGFQWAPSPAGWSPIVPFLTTREITWEYLVKHKGPLTEASGRGDHV